MQYSSNGFKECFAGMVDGTDGREERCAEAYLKLLSDYGVDYFFMNPGTDTAPLNEVFAKFTAKGIEKPSLVLVPHEIAATSMAYGYALVSGKPQVVMVHVTVGTANALGGVMSAYRARVPMIFTAGRTPITEEGVEGGRDISVHWGQESFDQGGLLREFVKWDYELRTTKQLRTVVDRAFRVATTEPQGPVYLILPREWLMEKVRENEERPIRMSQPASLPNADTGKLREVARLLLDADNPLIITSRLGRRTDAVNELVKLAELLAIPVVEAPKYFMNFPTENPLHVGFDPKPYLERADMVLLIDSDIPWIPTTTKPREDAKIIHIDIDPAYTTYPIWGYSVDIPIIADPGLAIIALNSILGEYLSDEKLKLEEIRDRYEKIREEHNQQRDLWKKTALKAGRSKSIDFSWLSFVVNEVKDEDTILFNEYDLDSTQIELTKPGTYFRTSPAAWLGSGLGAAIGGKMAAPTKTVIACMGDGSYMFGVPTACHWVSNKYTIPFLAIIFNNQCYNAVKRTVRRLFPNGWSVKTGKFAGVDLDPSPNFAQIAEANNCHGETVKDPKELKDALMRGLKTVREQKRQALIDVICKQP
jgi:acetolactate synthase-1/2/3 large subunit